MSRRAMNPARPGAVNTRITPVCGRSKSSAVTSRKKPIPA